MSGDKKYEDWSFGWYKGIINLGFSHLHTFIHNPAVFGELLTSSRSVQAQMLLCYMILTNRGEIDAIEKWDEANIAELNKSIRDICPNAGAEQYQVLGKCFIALLRLIDKQESPDPYAYTTFITK